MKPQGTTTFCWFLKLFMLSWRFLVKHCMASARTHECVRTHTSSSSQRLVPTDGAIRARILVCLLKHSTTAFTVAVSLARPPTVPELQSLVFSFNLVDHTRALTIRTSRTPQRTCKPLQGGPSQLGRAHENPHQPEFPAKG